MANSKGSVRVEKLSSVQTLFTTVVDPAVPCNVAATRVNVGQYEVVQLERLWL